MADTELERLPMSAPHITGAEIDAVADVLRSGCLSLGPKLEEFECAVSGYLGVRHAVGVSSGTAGLHLAILAAGIERGDLVITTPFSFVASSNCLLYEGAEPLFVDIDPVTGNVDVSLVDAAIRSARDDGRAACLKAILPVHVFGQPVDMEPLGEVARDHGLFVIEDACEAIGSEYRHRRVGGLGDAAVFAFYPNKQITTGEGGMIVTDRDDWATRFRSQRNQGRDLMDGWLRHDRLGYNYRMDELSAALGVAQFARIDELLEARDRVARWYCERLADAQGLALPAIAASTTRMSWFVFVVRLAQGIDRDTVVTDLAERGIPSRTYFTPIHLQPFYADRFGFKRGDFPVSEALGDSCLALPFSGTMTEAQVDRVCQTLTALVDRADRRSREHVFVAP